MQCFKEWQVICEALASGEQSIILRKGGIHEGKGGFSFGNVDSFLLFPTRFHAQGEQVHLEGDFTPGKEWEAGDEVQFKTLCKVVNTYELTDWEVVKTLAPYHLWTESCIEDRFYWEGRDIEKGMIHLALLRTYTLATPLSVEYSKKLGGCRSWVELEEFEEPASLTPILCDEDFQKLQEKIKDLSH